MNRVVPIALIALLLACGASRPLPARIEPLPPLPFALSEGPRELRNAWSRAQALLDVPAPTPPADGFDTVDDAGAWANESMIPFAHDYLEQMSSVTDPLAGAVALDGSLRVFAASIAALLYERLLAVLDLPVPRDIEDEPESVLAYRSAFAAALEQTVAETRALLEECISGAAERTDAQAWGADCAVRLEALPPS